VWRRGTLFGTAFDESSLLLAALSYFQVSTCKATLLCRSVCTLRRVLRATLHAYHVFSSQLYLKLGENFDVA
jgi:hypothetical protein